MCRKSTAISKCFEDLGDPRLDHHNVRHKFMDIVVMSICAVLSGAENFTDIESFGKAKEEWLRGFLELPFGIPSHDTINNIFRAIDSEEFNICFTRWVNSLCKRFDKEIVALDGKTIRRSFDKASELKALHVVSAWGRESGLVLGQVAVSEKSNEITAIPKLLDLLELEGCIVTIDAMGCQKKIAAKIREQGADYVLTLKKNHGNLYDDVEDFFEGHRADGFCKMEHDFHETTDGDHGRVEVRQYYVSSDIAWLGADAEWKDLKSIGMVERERTVGDKTEHEVHYCITSLGSNAKQFGGAVRGHWAVENSLHWILDVNFREDESRARKDNAAANFAILRKIALNLVKADNSIKGSFRQRRWRATWDQDYMLQLLLQESKLSMGS